MITNSIRFKASVLYTSILCLILVCFSAYLFHAVRQILYNDVQEELRIKGEQIIGTINAYAEITRGKLPSMSLVRQFLNDKGETTVGKEVIDKLWEKHRWSLGLHNDFFRIVNSDGRSVLQSENLPQGAEQVFSQLLPLRPGDPPHFSDIQMKGMPFRGMNYAFTFSNRTTYILQLVIPLTPVNRVLSRLVFFIIIGIFTVLLLSIFVGSFLTHRILKPVTDITRVANNISQTNLSVRIAEQSLDEEMKLLVDSFNQMIERLEKSFTHINEFSSHVAHELKTPLAIMKGELELALAGEHSKEEAQRVMAVTLLETDRLIKTVKDLLLLAKFEYKQEIFKMEKLDLTEFLKDIYQHSQILASQKEIRLNQSFPAGPVWVNGDVVHLRRLFFNLVHNAVKFTPNGGVITITVVIKEGVASISVKDTGIGIAPANQARIFEKFFRARRSDQTDAGGNGLGLCLARSIARAHGGDITFESELNKGSTFTATLPVYSELPA